MPRSTRRTTTAAQHADGKENQANRVQSQKHEHVTPSSKKARHRLSTTELACLEDVFKQDTHPSRQRKKDLAAQLGMDYKTITIWFQNKRQTSKRAHSNWRRTRADSCLRTVSSPSHNATLASAEAPAQIEADSTTSSKAIFKIKPLFDSLNKLTSRSDERHEHAEATDEASSNATDIDGPHQPQMELGNMTEPTGRDRVVTEQEQPRGNARPVRWKRVRTLEWACERQSKRHKSSREGYVRLGSEEVQDGDPNDAHMDSALSLLSLATSTHAGPSQDVMRGVSLLLSFKHSWRRR